MLANPSIRTFFYEVPIGVQICQPAFAKSAIFGLPLHFHCTHDPSARSHSHFSFQLFLRLPVNATVPLLAGAELLGIFYSLLAPCLLFFGISWLFPYFRGVLDPSAFRAVSPAFHFSAGEVAGWWRAGEVVQGLLRKRG